MHLQQWQGQLIHDMEGGAMRIVLAKLIVPPKTCNACEGWYLIRSGKDRNKLTYKCPFRKRAVSNKWDSKLPTQACIKATVKEASHAN